MKKWRKAAGLMAIMAVVGAILILAGCGGSSTSSANGTQTAEVARGNLATTISSVGSISMPKQSELTFGSGGSTTDVSTVSEVNVKFGDSVKEGDVLAKLDTASLERAVKQAEANLRTAQINLEQATSKTNLLKAEAAVQSAEVAVAQAQDDLEKAKTSDISSAEGTLRDAEVQLENARRSLTVAKQNADIALASAEDAVKSAYEAYSDFVVANIEDLELYDVAAQKDELYNAYLTAQQNLEIAKTSAQNSIATAQNNVARAEDTVQQAQEYLEELEVGSVTFQQKEVALAQAEASLSAAQDDLAYVKAGHDVELLQIKVDDAQVAVDEAHDQLAAATIVAPFDGVVAEVGADVGDSVTTNTVIIHLVNMGEVEVDASVDEIDVASVKVGQMAMITLDALPNARLMGKVSAISPVATSSSGVVTYAIRVGVTNADGVGLKDGMSATIQMIYVQAEDALLVPSNAIKRSGMNQVVDVVAADGTTEERMVQVGATNGTLTEIKSGLEEGEKVAVAASAASNDFPQGFRGFGMAVESAPSGGFGPRGDRD